MMTVLTAWGVITTGSTQRRPEPTRGIANSASGLPAPGMPVGMTDVACASSMASVRSVPVTKLPSVLALVVIACGSSQAPARPAAVGLEVPQSTASDPLPPGDFDAAPGEFLQAWPEIERCLGGKGPEQIDELVEPSTGLYVLDNPGALVVVTKHPTFTSAFADREYAPFLRNCDLRTDVEPQFSCDTEAWTPAGCVHTHGVRLDLAAISEWMLRDGGELSEPEVQKELASLRESQALITEAVSDSTTDTRWYFGTLRGRWWLLAVDVVTPCSA